MIKKYSKLKQAGKVKELLLAVEEGDTEYLSRYTDVPVKTWDKLYHETSQPWDLDYNFYNVPETTGKKASLSEEEIRKSPFTKPFIVLLNYKRNLSPEEETRVFSMFRRETTVPMIDEAFNNPIYFAEKKNRKVRLIFLPPAEYFVAAAKNRGPGHSEQTERQMLDENLVQEYVEAAKKGAKFPALNLDFTSGDQEGRHRARVAEIIGLPYVPVFVYDYYKESEKKK